MTRTMLLIGTRKGLFILESDKARRDWELRGPYCDCWPINHAIADPASGTIYAGGGNEWFGPAVWKSTDLGQSWTHSSDGLKYAEGEDADQIGVEPRARARAASMPASSPQVSFFRAMTAARPGARSKGLRNHPTRPQWKPGGAGLILIPSCRIPRDPQQIWVGISAAGVFYTPMAARPGSRAIAARAPISCPRASAIRNSGSACIAW